MMGLKEKAQLKEGGWKKKHAKKFKTDISLSTTSIIALHVVTNWAVQEAFSKPMLFWVQTLLQNKSAENNMF